MDIFIAAMTLARPWENRPVVYTDSPMDRAFDARGPRWLGVAEDLTISDGWRDRILLGFLGLFSLEGGWVGREGWWKWGIFLWFFSPQIAFLFFFFFWNTRGLNHERDVDTFVWERMKEMKKLMVIIMWLLEFTNVSYIIDNWIFESVKK